MILKNRTLLLLIAIIFTQAANGQSITYAKRVIKDLCTDEMAGRGYVDDGVNKAANYLGSEFRKLGLKKFNYSFFQNFEFPINTFPYSVKATLDGKSLQVGKDFLLSPTSGPCKGDYKLIHFNLKDSIEAELYDKKLQLGLDRNEAFVITNKPKDMSVDLYPISIKVLKSKMMNGLRPTANDGCELIFPDSIISNADSLFINAQNKEIKDFKSKNIIGYLPACKKKNRNKFIVFTAHYDHLGKMGDAVFPGASDNASGTAMVLNLAKHYAKSKNKYSMVFILFAGEEAGLLGSKYFTEHPTFNIDNIKMLVNLDIMGSAENGVTVVNATEFPQQFSTLQRINKKKNYLPKVKSRGPTSNSDHYFFYKRGIPSFFIYSMGGPGFYHDIYDTPESIPMKNYNNIFRLLTDFVATF